MRDSFAEQKANDLGTLAERATKLAAVLEGAEREASAIARECERLGVADRLARTLTRLQQTPSDAAETLQDDLDRLAGELHHPPVAADKAAPHHSDPTATAPTHEQLSVACSACGHHVLATVVDGATRQLRLDHRRYKCPRCGHSDRYETWDHFVEAENNAST